MCTNYNFSFEVSKQTLFLNCICLCLQNHHITIHDKKQPLLISMPKSKEKRGPIALVPELCYLTGNENTLMITVFMIMYCIC